MKNLQYIFIYIFIFASFVCCNKSGDSTYFNGEIRFIDKFKNVKNVTLKEVTLNGSNFGWVAAYDSLIIFMNPKLPDHYFNIFNLDTGKEIGSFCKRGQGPDETLGVSPIYQFFKERNDLKTLLFAPNENKLITWNISQSIEQGMTVMDTIVAYEWAAEHNGACYKYIFRQNEDTLLSYVQTVQHNDEEASLPFLQKRTMYSNKLLQNYDIYKETVRNGDADIMSETFFSTNDAFKPDGSKMVQVMGHLPQINILDIHTGKVIGCRLKDGPGFSYFETDMKSRKVYYLRAQADNNYIYASYWGKEPWGQKEMPDVNFIYVFNWQGELIQKLLLDHTISEFWLDHVRNRLYTTDIGTDEVFYLDLKTLNSDEHY